MEASHLLIMEALFQAGIIYKSYLNENKKAIKMLTELCERYPQNKNHSPLALYNLYVIYIDQSQNKKAENCKAQLLSNFPESKYSKLLNQPNYLANIEKRKKNQKEHYENTLLLYNKKNYTAVILECDSILITTESKELKSKYDLLKALAIGKSNDSINFKKELVEIVKNHPESEVKIKAEEIIALLENPEKMLKINKEIERGTPYIFEQAEAHYFMLIMPKEQTDVNFIKTLLSDYHSKQYSIETFEITATLLGQDRHLIMIKTFENSSLAADYYKDFASASKVNNELSKTESQKLIISAQNFQHFFKYQDIEKYYEFFINNYLTELSN